MAGETQAVVVVVRVERRPCDGHGVSDLVVALPLMRVVAAPAGGAAAVRGMRPLLDVGPLLVVLQRGEIGGEVVPRVPPVIFREKPERECGYAVIGGRGVQD